MAIFKIKRTIGFALLLAALSGCFDGETLVLNTPAASTNTPAFTVGQSLCGPTHPYTCPAVNPTPWGIVIYADLNPQVSGFHGLAVSVADVVPGFNGSGAGTVYATVALETTDTGTNNYGIYGGINGTFKDHQGNPQDGNTKIYCNFAANDCALPPAPPTTSAFNACANYSNGPTLAGGWYLPSVGELALLSNFAQTQPLSLATMGVQTFDSFWYWASTQNNGATDVGNLGNLGYAGGAGDPANQAYFWGFIDTTLGAGAKNDTNYGVRCVQALPL